MHEVLLLLRLGLRCFFTGRHALAEPLNTTTAGLALLLPCVDRMAHPADFDRHLLHSGGNEKHSTTGRARGLGIREYLRMSVLLHCGESVAGTIYEASQERAKILLFFWL